jgi:hypothetical protein
MVWVQVWEGISEQQSVGTPPSAAMKILRIGGGPIFWAVILLLLYMAVRAPITLQGLFLGIGHLLGSIGKGFVQFLNDLGIK